jgi:hypothetical protein
MRLDLLRHRDAHLRDARHLGQRAGDQRADRFVLASCRIAEHHVERNRCALHGHIPETLRCRKRTARVGIRDGRERGVDQSPINAHRYSVGNTGGAARSNHLADSRNLKKIVRRHCANRTPEARFGGC